MGKTPSAPYLLSRVRELARELSVVRQPAGERIKINDPETASACVAVYLEGAGCLDRENIGLLLLDSSNRLLCVQIVGTGTVNQAAVYPREVARAALAVNSTALILFHNHPGGQLQASAEDLEITRSLREALQLLEIRLHDHLIYASGRCYSICGGREVDPGSLPEGLPKGVIPSGYNLSKSGRG